MFEIVHMFIALIWSLHIVSMYWETTFYLINMSIKAIIKQWENIQEEFDASCTIATLNSEYRPMHS